MPAVDIELTNSCNTVCIFCPRDKTSELGFIDFRTFERAVVRVQEMVSPPEMKFCGTGEPLLHPEIARFVRYLVDRGLSPTISTNASLLTEAKSQQLLDAGINKICFSASGIFEGYEKIHRLKFKTVRRNIERFSALAGSRCDIKISVVRCAENRDHIDAIKQFWQEVGIRKIVLFDYVNRNGNLDLGYAFDKSRKFDHEARELLAANGLHALCLGPLVFNFIGWNGRYYMCSNEFAKKRPLGDVFQLGLEAVKDIKMKLMAEGNEVCQKCDLNVVNQIREILFDLEKGKAALSDLDATLSEMRDIQETGRVLYQHKV